MPKINVSANAGVTVLSSRILAERPMVRINGKVHYLSSGTSMAHAGGEVVSLFKNTWMRACGVAKSRKDGSRHINKMGNLTLSLDVDDDRDEFDSAVINTIRAAIPEFNTQESLLSFYKELGRITGENESLVRRGVASSLGKIAVEDLLLSGALSKKSPFFTTTSVGQTIRQRGIAKYGIIEVLAELDSNNNPSIVNYPEDADPDFENLKETHLPQNFLSSDRFPQASTESFSSSLWLKITTSTTGQKLGALILLGGLAMLTVGTCGLAGAITALSLSASVGLTSAGGSMILGLSYLKHIGFFDSSKSEVISPERVDGDQSLLNL